jgi:hypothetical protein
MPAILGESAFGFELRDGGRIRGRRITSGSNCRHLNRHKPKMARRSILPAYHGVTAKLQHFRLFLAPIKTPDGKHKTCQVSGRSQFICRRNIYRRLLVIIIPLVRAIKTLIVVVGVIPVGVMTIIIGLTLIVIAVGIIAVGIPWPYGNGNLSFRLRRIAK